MRRRRGCGELTTTNTKPSTRELVYRTVLRQIINWTFPPGSPISENELASNFGVSRTPVREAILLLERDRFVDVIPKVGTFVSKLNPETIRSAQFVREAIECASIASVQFPLNEPAMATLERNLQEQRGATGVAEFIRLDDAFHRSLMELSGRAESWRIASGAKAHLDQARHMTRTTKEDRPGLVDQHASIVAALRDGDALEAEKLLREHLRIVIADIQVLEKAAPDLFGPDSPPWLSPAFVSLKGMS